MKLNFNQIKNITQGAVRFKETNGKIQFFRFTEQQEKLYKKASLEQNRDFYNRSFASSGICLSFLTNSTTLDFKIEALSCTSRTYFSFDLFINGTFSDSLNNFENITLPQNYTEVELPLGRFSKKFALGQGIKEVTIYFPWSILPLLEELSIDDGSFFEAVKQQKKLLAFGDSITQGYDALHPYMRYVSQLSRLLSAEEINKGIGGEIFFPDLANTRDDFTPDYITVAYGTNDWNKITQNEFESNCFGFFSNLSRTYSSSKIFAITPIWRKDHTEYRPFGAFENTEIIIRNTVSAFKNITLISGIDFVPKDISYFSDLRLHPNDLGFEHYSKNLYEKIKQCL